MAEALGGIRVLEAGGGAALAYAGKLFSDFGAEVWKLPEADDPLRHAWPDLDGRSALEAWLTPTSASPPAASPRWHRPFTCCSTPGPRRSRTCRRTSSTRGSPGSARADPMPASPPQT
jgi:hypothetical protein